MKLSISKGNMKVGKTLNISLPPVTACKKNLPCFEKCYARKSYRQYPNVRNAWDGNFDLYRENPGEYKEELRKVLSKTKYKYFRWHVAGDVPDQNYLEMVYTLAEEFPAIKFLLNTKRYDFKFRAKSPSNLFIFKSTWPGLSLPKEFERRNWLSHDERKPNKTFKCTGACDDCRYCWGEKDWQGDVEFDLH